MKKKKKRETAEEEEEEEGGGGRRYSSRVRLLHTAAQMSTPMEGSNKKWQYAHLENLQNNNRYVPSFLPPPLATKGKDSEKKKDEERPKEKEKGKSRNIDHFMEELKLEQELREKRNQEREQWREGRNNENPAQIHWCSSILEPNVTCPILLCCPASCQVDENFLLRTFGRFGPIASVKIMWPRTEEERRRQRNCGFVAFMNRADGQAAKDEMQGTKWARCPFLIMRVELERTLTDSQRDEFEDMLRALTLERSQIKDAMGFSLDNADAAGEVVEVLTESLTLKETPIPTKVARLMLVSDILHNSSAPVKNASAYRTKFEASLPDIMESFNDLYRSITGRITAEALKERVLKVLQVWSDWFLFSDAYVNGLRATFLRSSNSGVIPFHSICGDAPEIEKKTSSEVTTDGGKLNQDAALAMGKGAAMKELLNLPLAELERRCRHNGLSLCGGREMMVSRLLSLEEAEKQRVYEREDDMKYGQSQSNSTKYSRDESIWNANIASSRENELGLEPSGSSGWSRYGDEVSKLQDKGFSVPLAPTLAIPQPELKAFSKNRKSDPVLPASKWAREDDVSDDERKDAHGLGLSYSSSGSENAGGGAGKADEQEVGTDTSVPTHLDSSTSEEHRQKLRRLEVSVIEYRESLEERGIRSSEEIERKVSSYRRRLQSEFGLSDSAEDVLGNNKHVAQRTSLERKDKYDESRDSSRKRHRSHSRSRSPQRKSSIRDRDRDTDGDRDRERHRDKAREPDSERGREREKSGSRERDDHDKSRERDRDRRRKEK
ncbi:protein RRC1-like protein isoform X1 [Cinnamomum micranthum f. kanehirae]|uniref:Protein RRC1-like protein isoform X1 n=1 Tax=Cinnamomum micranthum f. kanehirae TaxID=337451 RepID=A0A3S3MVY8_9MAGN|nr:protein RRC1-like protein isoform X1 [Cinnamomum micranthum f. kanehirae]